MNTKIFKIIASTFALGACIQSLGVLASSADMDTSFSSAVPVGLNFIAMTVDKTPDGGFLVGGAFRSYKGISTNRIVKIYPDGNIDTTFNIGSGFNDVVQTIKTQSDGKILVGGRFNSYQGVPVNGIVRLNTNGSIDTSFDIGDGLTLEVFVPDIGLQGYEFDTYGTTSIVNGAVETIIIQPNGKILIGGDFDSYQGISANRIIRLNTDGSRDFSFDMGGGFDGIVEQIALQVDGKVIVGGYFWAFSGMNANKIIRLNTDGSIDNTFVIGDGFDGGVSDIKVQSDGKILVGGNFTTYKGVSANNIIRLNTDGSRDSSFVIGDGFDGYVNCIKIQSDGKILVGGGFASYKGFSAQRIIRLTTTGAKDSSLNIGIGFSLGTNGHDVIGLFIQPDNSIIAIGGFTEFQKIATNYIIKLTSTGSKDSSFGVGDGFDRQVISTAVQSDGRVLVGGEFSSYKGISTNNLIRLNADGSRDTSFVIGSGFDDGDYSALNRISTIAIQVDGKIVVGGEFNSYKGTPANKLIRLNTDGSRDSSFVVGDGFDGEIFSIAIQSDGKILVGGQFSSYKGTSVSNLIRLHSDGSRDTEFDVGNTYAYRSPIKTIKIQSDGKILVGGAPSDGYGYKSLIRFTSSGSIDSSFGSGGSFNDGASIDSIAIQADGKIVAAGDFYSYQGITANKLIRLNTDGSIDTGFDVGNGFDEGNGRSFSIKSIAVQNNGKIIAGGYFSSFEGTPTNKLIRINIDGTRDMSFDIGNGIGVSTTNQERIGSIEILSGGKILVGGNFTRYKQGVAGYLIQLYGDVDMVNLPNSTDTGTVTSAFTTQGYTQTSGSLVGSTPISLGGTDGNIPTTLDITNQNLNLNIPGDTQIKQGDHTTNYSGVLSVPIINNISSVNNQQVIVAFNVGSNSSSITLTGGYATLLIPVPGQMIGTWLQVYYSSDNGVTWYPEIITQVISYNGQPYIQFTTNHFGDFAITKLPDTILPVITLIGDATINITQGTTYTDAGATASDNIDGDITANIVTSGSINTAVAGTYIISYNVSDAAGNQATQVIRTINVNAVTSGGGSNGGGGSSSSSSSSSSLATTILDEALHGAAIHEVGNIQNSPYSEELNNAYLWAFGYDITTMNTIQKANMEGTLIRKDMAKMVSNFAINVLKKNPSSGPNCTFSDTKGLTEEAKSYIALSCKLGLMGFESNGTTIKKNFDPLSEVDRGQFGTILSRLLRAGKYNGGTPYYTKHLNALKAAGIMTKITTPLQKEIRGYVMLMMMRATSK